LNDIPRGQWINLVFNLNIIVSKVFKQGIYYNNLDSFAFRHGSLFRKIFTLPISAINDNDDIIIPAIYDYPLGTNTITFCIEVTSSNNNNTNNTNNTNKVKSVVSQGLIIGSSKQKTSLLQSNKVSKGIVRTSPLKIKEQSSLSSIVNHHHNNNTNNNKNDNITIGINKSIVDNEDEEILNLLNEDYDNNGNNNSNQNFYDYIENNNNNESNDNEYNNININDDINDNTNDDIDNFEASPKTENIIAKVISTKLFDKDQILTKSYLQQSIFNFHNNDNDTTNNKIDKQQKILEKLNKLQSRLSEEELSYALEYNE